MPISWILLIIVIIGGMIWYNSQKTQRLTSEGKIIKRGGLFYQEGEEFTIAEYNPTLVTKKIQGLSYSEMHVSMSGNSEQQVFHFKGPTFEAQLSLREHDQSRAVYGFNFTRWKTNHNGSVYSVYEMNMLLTAIEKMFLSIDPTAQVRNWKMETKTKPRLF